MRNLRFSSLLLITVLLISTALGAYSQTSRGSVTGIVKDPSGAVIANAEVTLSSTSTGVNQTTKSNSAGIYHFDAVLAGDYTVAAKAAGFSQNKANVTVNAGLVTGFDFDMKVGGSGDTVTVEASGVQLQTEEAARGGSIPANSLANLPIAGQNSLNLMLTLPGVARSNQGGSLDSGIGAVNGARARSNNFMIDGLQNNDISVAGPSFTLTNNDAIQEVSVQTSNFTAEFGRSGGAVINQVTKSGSNTFHGTLATVYRSQVLNASTRTQRNAFANGSTKDLKNKFHENIPAFTIGGPVMFPGYNGHSRTFFFAAGQWDRYSENSSTTFSAVPTAAGVATLQALAGTCPNVAKYLSLLGSARGSSGIGSSAIDISLPATVAGTSCGGGARTGQTVQVGAFVRAAPRVFLDNNHLIRVDHVVSDKQNMMFRWLWDSNSDTSGNTGISPAFDIPFKGKTLSGTFNDAYMIRDNLINEFRFGYTRYNYGWFFTDNSSLGATTPDIGITGMSSLAVSSTFPQGRIANSWQYQDTMGWTKGTHSFRFGAEFLRQLSVQVAPFNSRGQVGYNNTPVTGAAGGLVTGLANFIDDFSGNTTNAVAISFGSGKYRPNLFTWTMFFQDSWKLRSDLTINYGLRYENFGQPANQFKYPAFVGYGDNDITSTTKVDPDNNNFGPNFGFSWNPHWNKGLGGLFSGDGKTVLRGGYQVSYDTWFNNLLSNMAAGSPNALTNPSVPGTSTAATPRGVANLSAILPTLVPTAVTPYTSQTSMFSKHIRNPYYHRFSFGIQRELPSRIVMDLSYVGSLGRQLFYTNPLNPALPNAAGTAPATQSTPFGTQTLRLHANRGLVQIRDSGLTSNYNAMQLQVRKKIGSTVLGDMAFSSAYTWSKNMDVLTETFASNSSGQNPSRSPALGIPLKELDYGPSDNDRRHVWSNVMLWNVKGPKRGVLGQVLGGWSFSPIITIQSGTPFTILNGSDRDMDGSTLGDRPNIGNPNAPLNTRALVVPIATCATGLRNPANNTCVTANDVHWVQVTTYSITGPIEGRNANYTTGYFTMDANILKTFRVTERWKLEYRAEIFNLTNNENFDTPVTTTNNRNVTASNGTNFLNYNLQSGGSRTMRMGLKVIF